MVSAGFVGLSLLDVFNVTPGQNVPVWAPQPPPVQPDIKSVAGVTWTVSLIQLGLAAWLVRILCRDAHSRR